MHLNTLNNFLQLVFEFSAKIRLFNCRKHGGHFNNGPLNEPRELLKLVHSIGQVQVHHMKLRDSTYEVFVLRPFLAQNPVSIAVKILNLGDIEAENGLALLAFGVAVKSAEN